MVYAIPNLLSYSFIFNKWMDQIEILEAENDQIALAYVYAVIARKLIFFDIVNVTAEAEDEMPDDFW
jgi:DNA integrity scanning protein DisA with diadenylate cyclase activity